MRKTCIWIALLLSGAILPLRSAEWVTHSGDNQRTGWQKNETAISIFMVNTGQAATATVRTPGGRVTYHGDAAIDGVPGTAAPYGTSRRSTSIPRAVAVRQK